MCIVDLIRQAILICPLCRLRVNLRPKSLILSKAIPSTEFSRMASRISHGLGKNPPYPVFYKRSLPVSAGYPLPLQGSVQSSLSSPSTRKPFVEVPLLPLDPLKSHDFSEELAIHSVIQLIFQRVSAYFGPISKIVCPPIHLPPSSDVLNRGH